MELDKTSGECLQSRTKYNEMPEDNDRLVDMLERNAYKILRL